MNFLKTLLVSTLFFGTAFSQNADTVNRLDLTPNDDNQEIIIEVPVTILNLAVMQSGEFPEFLTRRGDFKRLKRKTGNGKGVKVGIVDTGLDRTHAMKGGDLEIYDGTNPSTYRVREAKDFTESRSGWGDVSSHGSHVAGHIGAAANGKGIEGIASECELFIAKGLGDRGFGSDTQISNSIEWLISKDVDIINLSLGGGFSQRIENAVLKARRAGIIVFAAMGNNGNRGDGHPGNSDNSLGIVAVDYSYDLAAFSSRSNQALLSGFGVDVYSCLKSGGYGALSGTSMATPDQVGIAALIVGYLRNNGVDVKNTLAYWTIIKNSIRDLGPRNWDRGYGYGFLEIWDVLDHIDENIIKRPVEPPVKTPNDPPTNPPVNPPTNPPSDPVKNPFEEYKVIGSWNNELGEYLILQKKTSGTSSLNIEKFIEKLNIAIERTSVIPKKNDTVGQKATTPAIKVPNNTNLYESPAYKSPVYRRPTYNPPRFNPPLPSGSKIIGPIYDFPKSNCPTGNCPLPNLRK